jgi:mannose-6-phosphate isomerase-like protein (cupin superfamily)
MLDHAAGNLAPAFALAGDMHVLLHTEGRKDALLWTVIGGALLEGGALDGQTAAIARPASDVSRSPRLAGERAAELIACDKARLKWRRGLSGMTYAPTRTPHAKFMKLKPGQSAPLHGHSGLEATVVVHGRFSDGHGEYSRGDLVFGKPGTRHRPRAEGNEVCICLVAQAPHWIMRGF